MRTNRPKSSIKLDKLVDDAEKELCKNLPTQLIPSKNKKDKKKERKEHD